MYTKAEIGKLGYRKPVIVQSGWKDSYFFAIASVLRVDEVLNMVELTGIEVLFSGKKARIPQRSGHFGINDVWVRGPTGELNIESPFALVVDDDECTLAGSGFPCRRLGNLLEFPERGIRCAWTKSTGFIIGNDKKAATLNGQSQKVKFVVRNNRVEWHHGELKN